MSNTGDHTSCHEQVPRKSKVFLLDMDLAFLLFLIVFSESESCLGRTGLKLHRAPVEAKRKLAW